MNTTVSIRAVRKQLSPQMLNHLKKIECWIFHRGVYWAERMSKDCSGSPKLVTQGDITNLPGGLEGYERK